MSRFFTLAQLLLLTGCATIYGIKKNTLMSEKKMHEIAKSYGIDSSFILTKEYFSKIEPLKDSLMRKHHIQPLQALYFNERGKNISSLYNCNAGGFANLNWSKAGDLTQFPPLTPSIKDTISLQTLLALTSLTEKVKPDISLPDYTIVIFWNDFMGRQTKRFIATIKKNMELSKSSNMKLIYINDDNLYYE